MPVRKDRRFAYGALFQWYYIRSAISIVLSTERYSVSTVDGALFGGVHCRHDRQVLQ